MKKIIFIFLFFIPCYFSLFLNETSCGELIDFHNLNKCHIVILNEKFGCECLTCNLGATLIEVNNTVRCLDQRTPGYEKLKHCKEALFNTENKECSECEYGYTEIEGECQPKVMVDHCKKFEFNETTNISECVECEWQYGGPFDNDNPPINGQCPPKCTGKNILEFSSNECTSYPWSITKNCLDYDKKEMICKDCIDGYYLDDKGKCHRFNDGCKMGREDYCAQCFDGYYFDWDRKCMKCQEHCIACNEYHVCYKWDNSSIGRKKMKKYDKMRKLYEVKENNINYLKIQYMYYLMIFSIFLL